MGLYIPDEKSLQRNSQQMEQPFNMVKRDIGPSERPTVFWSLFYLDAGVLQSLMMKFIAGILHTHEASVRSVKKR